MKRLLVAVALLGAAALVACNDGVSTQRRPIGSSCATAGQCGTGKYFCLLQAPDGDCEAECNRDGDCPLGSVCVGAGLILAGACHADCAASADCRAGYLCTLSDDASHAYCAPPPVTDGGDDAM